MDASVPDLSGQVAGLVAGTIDLNQFYRWFVLNGAAIEVRGTNDAVDFHNTVENMLAE